MDQHVQLPQCEQCGTAQHLMIESYSPPEDGARGMSVIPVRGVTVSPGTPYRAPSLRRVEP